VNGKIFAMMSFKGKFVVKLPKKLVDELVSGGRGEHFDPGHGRIMKEWVAVGTREPNWVVAMKDVNTFVRTSLPRVGAPTHKVRCLVRLMRCLAVPACLLSRYKT
jgi:hypothetical protein